MAARRLKRSKTPDADAVVADDVPVTAPRAKATGGRPSVADAKRQAKSSIAAANERSDRPGQVSSAEPGLVYYYWDALEVDAARIARLRLMLEGRGYWKADGPEHVPGVPHAEIWATYAEVKRELDRGVKRRHDQIKRRLSGRKT